MDEIIKKDSLQYEEEKKLYCGTLVSYKGKWGFVNNKGKEIIPILYNKIDIACGSPDIIKVNLDNQWGAFTMFGKLITSPKYEDIEYRDIIKVKTITNGGN